MIPKCLPFVFLLLVPSVVRCAEAGSNDDVYADLRKNPHAAKLLETWKKLRGSGDQPVFDPETRREAEWLRRRQADLAPVLVEIARRDPNPDIRADAVSSCSHPAMDKTPMLGLIRGNLAEWFSVLPYATNGLHPYTPFMWACCGYLADFGDEGDLALLGTLAANKDPEKAAWAEIAADRLAFLRKRLAKEGRARKSSRDAGPSLRKPPPSHRTTPPPNRTPAPEPAPSAPAWKTPVMAAAAALLLAAVLLALRSKPRRNP